MSEALRHDPNPAVRLKAIEALRGTGSEPDVQSAILAALAGDDNSGVRIQALDTLFEQMGSGESSSTPLDDQAVSILRDRMRNDSNSYIRSRSADALGRLASWTKTHRRQGGVILETSQTPKAQRHARGSALPEPHCDITFRACSLAAAGADPHVSSLESETAENHSLRGVIPTRRAPAHRPSRLRRRADLHRCCQ